jgi:hypothetical protein
VLSGGAHELRLGAGTIAAARAPWDAAGIRLDRHRYVAKLAQLEQKGHA